MRSVAGFTPSAPRCHALVWAAARSSLTSGSAQRAAHAQRRCCTRPRNPVAASGGDGQRGSSSTPFPEGQAAQNGFTEWLAAQLYGV